MIELGSQVAEALEAIRAHSPLVPQIALTLGSGLGGAIDGMDAGSPASFAAAARWVAPSDTLPAKSATPTTTRRPSSRRVGRIEPRAKSRAPSNRLPIVSRASASAPGEKARPAALMPTNAADQRTTETSAAARGSEGRGVGIAPEFYVFFLSIAAPAST